MTNKHSTRSRNALWAAALAASAISTPVVAQDSPLSGVQPPLQPFERGERNTQFDPATEDQFRATIQSTDIRLETQVLADGLEYPWGVTTLPGDAGFLVTEQSGALRHIGGDGTVSDPIAGVPDVLYEEQGGLLDVNLDPQFDQNRYVYLTYSKPMGENADGTTLSATAAARGRLSADRSRLEEVVDIFVQEPASPSPMHYGSRIVFGPDGHAFITTGEHFTEAERQLAQDLSTTYGKIIRVNRDGTVPADNPFTGDGDAIDTIWSYGHRNVQGAAIAGDGTLWTIEHGPKGGDELNQPRAGANYGWPVVSYGETYQGNPIGSGAARAQGFEEPVYFWDPVIAPGGMAVHDGDMFDAWNGDLLIGSFVARGIVRLDVSDDNRIAVEERILSQLGRVNDVDVMADGSFVLVTDKESGQLIHVTTADSASSG